MIHKNNNYKFGFSLFEVVVTMSIVAIFIAASSNVFTQRHKNRVANPSHGRLECYYGNDNKLHQRLVFENVVSSDSVMEDGKCTFTPNNAASYLIISAVGGGGAGGTDYGGSAGQFETQILSNTTHKLEIFPGKGAAVDVNKGEDTIVIDIGTGEEGFTPKELLKVEGGVSESFSNDADSLKLGECAVTYARYSCGSPYSCEANNTAREVTVRYCTQNSQPDDENPQQYVRTTRINYNDLLEEYSNDTDFANGLISYEQSSNTDDACKSNTAIKDFAITLKVLGNSTQYTDYSPIRGVINSIRGISGGIAGLSKSPGSGGAKDTPGGDGAVIIVW